MVYARWWFHYIFIILHLHTNIIANQNDEVVECAFLENGDLQFYCRGSVEQENSHKGSYFCCEIYFYCYDGNWNHKSEILSTVFAPGCQFTRFELNFFKSYVSIEKLSLSNTGLQAVRLQDFTYAKNLMEFNASNNKITEIPTMVFVNAPEITTVDFSFNEISRIDPMAFEQSSVDHSSKLSVLDLSNNKIVSIDNRTFAALPALTELYLSSNFIQVIDQDVFVQNKGLNVLQLSYNKLTTFACQSFENLTHLDLGSNSLTLLDENGIRSENYYLNLNIDNNQFRNITLTTDYMHLQAFSNQLKWIAVESDLDSLEHFNVSKNRIENIPEIFDRFGKELKVLDVTDNYVGRLNVTTFMKMPNLEELVLRNTTLSNIQYGTFHHQKNLKLLDISFNNLKTIKFNVFWRDLQQLTTFLLDGNGLTEVNGLSKVQFPNVALIGITKNNFTCEYLGEYMWQWVGVSFVSDAQSNGSHIEKISCNSEDHYVSGYVTQKIQTELVTTVNEPSTNRVIVQPATSVNHILLVLVLVVLCILCAVVVTKNVIVIRRQWLRYRNEGNVTYCNETHDNFDGNLVEIIRTDLLHASD